MVRNDTFRDFDVAVIEHVAGRGLQEEERLLGDLVVQFADMVGVVATNGYNLFDTLVQMHHQLMMYSSTFFPWRTNCAAIDMSEESEACD